MKTKTAPAIERLGYYHGQLLAHHDLEDDSAFERRLRGLHVRGLHNTWGVALGFEVSWSAPGLIQAGPGLAYDVLGREILSARTVAIGAPPLPPGGRGWFDLAIRYDDEVQALAGRAPGCGPGVLPGEERPAWRWCFAGAGSPEGKPPALLSPELRLGEEIPVVRCRVTADGMSPELDFSFRRNAQGLVRPHIASGSLHRTFTFVQARQAFVAVVSTASGGFNRTPQYFARIRIPAVEELVRHDIVGPFVSIRNPARTGFQMEVRAGLLGEQFAIARSAATARLQATVEWAGIEANGGCTPEFDPLVLLRFLRVEEEFRGGFIAFGGGFHG